MDTNKVYPSIILHRVLKLIAHETYNLCDGRIHCRVKTLPLKAVHTCPRILNIPSPQLPSLLSECATSRAYCSFQPPTRARRPSELSHAHARHARPPHTTHSAAASDHPLSSSCLMPPRTVAIRQLPFAPATLSIPPPPRPMNTLHRPAFTTPLLPSNRARRATRICRSHTAVPVASASVVLAPGQGAQLPDMGASWRKCSEAAADVFRNADQLLKHDLPRPLSEYIFGDIDAATLARTDVAQPAIFVTSMACWAGLNELALIQPDELAVTAGLSLGEYTALTIAGAISFEDALRLVALRGRAMQDAADASDGGMVALIGADEATALQVVEASKQSDVLVAANFNAPGQVVLSGASAAVDRAATFASEHKKLRVAKLDVAGAFHSPLMEPAAERLATALESTSIGLPSVPVLSNVTGEPHEMGKVREMLVSQLTSSVRWAKCCDYIRNNYSDASWTELAPGKTLSGIMRKIDRKIKITNLSEAPVEAQA